MDVPSRRCKVACNRSAVASYASANAHDARHYNLRPLRPGWPGVAGTYTYPFVVLSDQMRIVDIVIEQM